MEVIQRIIANFNNSPCGVVRNLHRDNSVRRGAKISVFLASLALCFVVLSGKAMAEGADFNFSVTVQDTPVLEIILSDTSANLDVTPSMAAAGFNEIDMSVQVGTSNSTGYNLIMNVSSTDLISGENSIANLAEKDGGYTCTAATGADCDFTVNSWGYKIASNTHILSATNYLPVPDSIKLNENAEPVNADKTYLTFGSRVNAAQAAGEYYTTISFVAVANPTEPKCGDAGYICYNDNGANSATTMGLQEVTSNSKVMLWPSNFKRDGYGFAGWNTKSDLTGVTYGPMETIDTGDLSSHGLRLYAYWVPKSRSYTMQTFTATQCNSLTQATFNSSTGQITAGNIIALEDTRDRNVYAVARLTDGKCWMLENLRLGSSVTLNSQNTNNPSVAKLVSMAPEDWCQEASSDCLNQALVNMANTVSTVENMTNMEQNAYLYGNYYNWYAATAGTGSYQGSWSNPPAGSICPYHWRLPNSSALAGTQSFVTLLTSIGGGGAGGFNASTDPTAITMMSRLTAFPLNYLPAGQTFRNSIINKTKTGTYSTLSSYGPNGGDLFPMTFFNVNGVTSVNTYAGYDKYRGLSVRCALID